MSHEERLTRQEVARLAELEQVIERAEKDRGLALREVHDQRLYRQDYATFEQYCHRRWGISGNYGRQLIRHVSIQTMVGVENERQSRELARLAPEQAEAVMKKVTESGARVTAKAIAEARAEVIKAEPAKRYMPTPEEKQRRSKEAARLWSEGYHALDICVELGISKSSLYADLARHGISTHNGPRPVAGLKPRGHPMEVVEWRDQQEDTEPNVIRLKLVPGRAECDLDRESADRMINNADAGSDHLTQYVRNGYELTESQLERLVQIRDRIDQLISEGEKQKGTG